MTYDNHQSDQECTEKTIQGSDRMGEMPKCLACVWCNNQMLRAQNNMYSVVAESKLNNIEDAIESRRWDAGGQWSVTVKDFPVGVREITVVCMTATCPSPSFSRLVHLALAGLIAWPEANMI
jgi:hypothetical protein